MPSSPISPCPSCPPHAAGGHGCAVYSSSVTDAQWAILEPLLPAPGSTAGRGGRREKHCRRVIVDVILYIVRGGIAWRQLPVEFPPAGTVYAVFARWARSGAWQRILDALRDRLRVRAGRDRCPTAAVIDSQTVPAADTVPRSSRGWDGGKRTNGVYLKLMNWRASAAGAVVGQHGCKGGKLLFQPAAVGFRRPFIRPAGFKDDSRPVTYHAGTYHPIADVK